MAHTLSGPILAMEMADPLLALVPSFTVGAEVLEYVGFLY